MSTHLSKKHCEEFIERFTTRPNLSVAVSGMAGTVFAIRRTDGSCRLEFYKWDHPRSPSQVVIGSVPNAIRSAWAQVFE